MVRMDSLLTRGRARRSCPLLFLAISRLAARITTLVDRRARRRRARSGRSRSARSAPSASSRRSPPRTRSTAASSTASTREPGGQSAPVHVPDRLLGVHQRPDRRAGRRSCSGWARRTCSTGTLTVGRGARLHHVPRVALRADQQPHPDLGPDPGREGRRRARVRDPRDRSPTCPTARATARAERGARRDHASRTCTSATTPSRQVLKRRRRSSAAPATMIAIVGATGAGKTTLVSLIPRFYDPDRRPRAARRRRRARVPAPRRCASRSAMVLQPPLVFPTTLRENIAYGRPDATADADRRARRTWRSSTTSSRACPEGLDTVVGESGRDALGGRAARASRSRAPSCATRRS